MFQNVCLSAGAKTLKRRMVRISRVYKRDDEDEAWYQARTSWTRLFPEETEEEKRKREEEEEEIEKEKEKEEKEKKRGEKKQKKN